MMGLDEMYDLTARLRELTGDPQTCVELTAVGSELEMVVAWKTPKNVRVRLRVYANQIAELRRLGETTWASKAIAERVYRLVQHAVEV